MRKLSSLLLIALLAVAGIGCDSNSNDTSDAERFLGNWALTAVSDDAGPADSAFVANFKSILLDNADDDTFDLTVTPQVGDPIVISGTYTVSEADSRFTLSATVPGLGTANLVFTYVFNSDSEVVLTTVGQTAALLNLMFEGVSLEGQAEITISKLG